MRLLITGALNKINSKIHISLQEPRILSLHLLRIPTLDMMLERGSRAVDALLVVVSNGVETLLFGALQDPRHRVDAHIKGFDGWTEGEAHEVVARRREEVAAVRGVDVEEDAGDNDALLLEELLEEGLQSELSIT